MSLDIWIEDENGVELFTQNITHNLGKMAVEAGIYKCLWRHDENGIETAGQLIEPLSNAVRDMTARPEHYQQFDSPNGWGLYIHFLPWLEKLLIACIKWPNAKIVVSR